MQPVVSHEKTDDYGTGPSFRVVSDLHHGQGGSIGVNDAGDWLSSSRRFVAPGVHTTEMTVFLMFNVQGHGQPFQFGLAPVIGHDQRLVFP